MKIWDISRTLSNALAPWPGDTPFHFELAATIGPSAVVNVGAIQMSVHNGSHADARFHFEPDGWTIEQAGLATYFGPAVVVDLTQQLANSSSDLITVEQLNGSIDHVRQTSRLLLKTGVWPDSAAFPKRIPVIDGDVAEWLRANGVKLIGLDLPSVDSIDAKVLVNHHSLARSEISIIESLDLSAIEAGVYGFVALPLKIAGGDAAPVRAILWRDE
ncbi:MAG: cyclase family protein [Chthoniobacterales bacterium]